MAQFSSRNAAFTPVASTTQINSWVLTALTVGQLGMVKKYGFGGMGTTSTGYQTRWARVSNTPATPTALLIANTGSTTVTPQCSVNTYTTQATATAGASLDEQDWNVLGGGMQVVLPIGGEWYVVGGALGTAFNQIGCGNVTGSDANLSSYSLQFAE